MNRAAGALLSCVLAACSRGPAEPASTHEGAAPVGSFSREAFAPAHGHAGAEDLPVPTAVVPHALDEILEAASRAAIDGGAERDGRLGTDTGVPPDAGADSKGSGADVGKVARVTVGKVTVEPGLSAPAIERAARAELYWPLVQRCRDPQGAILPPEIIHVTFHLDRDGYVVPATILAVPKDARFAEAARCMARELTTTTFRGPAGARGRGWNVVMDVPSVD